MRDSVEDLRHLGPASQVAAAVGHDLVQLAAGPGAGDREGPRVGHDRGAHNVGNPHRMQDRGVRGQQPARGGRVRHGAPSRIASQGPVPSLTTGDALDHLQRCSGRLVRGNLPGVGRRGRGAAAGGCEETETGGQRAGCGHPQTLWLHGHLT